MEFITKDVATWQIVRVFNRMW